MSLKDALAAKITSKEQFHELVLANHGRFGTRDGAYDGFMDVFVPGSGEEPAYRVLNQRGTDYVRYWAPNGQVNALYPVHAWWLLREQLRIEYGYYEDVTEPIRAALSIATLRAFAVHVSRDDPSMLAYTPSRVDGVADRQVRVATGKLLRKLFPQLTDAEVQGIEAAHRADMSNELELVTGADRIAHVYMNMEGDTGCMRHSPSHWSLPDRIHPSMAYDAPGFAVAVHRNMQGEVTARAVTWVNPEDPTDKRYIRLYGDGILKRRLERNGYRLTNLCGARLRKIPWPSRSGTYVLPYMDRAGGPQGDTSTDDGLFVRLDGDWLRLISESEYRATHSAPNGTAYCQPAQNTGAQVRLEPVPANLWGFTCSISGREYDLRNTRKTKFIDETGKFHDGVAQAYLDEAGIVTTTLYTSNYGLCPAHRDAPSFRHRGVDWLDADEERRDNDFVRLDATLYPDEQEWINGDPETTVTTRGQHIKRADCVMLVVSKDQADRVHRSAVPDGAVKLRMAKRMGVFAAPGVEFYQTRAGRVHPATHDVVELYNGEWAFAGNVVSTVVLGRTVHRLHDEPRPGPGAVVSLNSTVEAGLQFTLKEGRGAGLTDAAIADVLRHQAVRTLPYRYTQRRNWDGGLMWDVTGDRKTYAETRAAVDEIAQLGATAAARYIDFEQLADAKWLLDKVDAFIASNNLLPVEAAPTEQATIDDRFTVAA